MLLPIAYLFYLSLPWETDSLRQPFICQMNMYPCMPSIRFIPQILLNNTLTIVTSTKNMASGKKYQSLKQNIFNVFAPRNLVQVINFNSSRLSGEFMMAPNHYPT